ncbi:hypothetical protein [Corynebacterium marquesiae]|uniref:hypothetical protein n=1 Tax=Corynebacterium marquesiae TaxID=2913503 RepID=UPI0022BA531B|nr:hypothetical protein [Corynebacterium marquesiae]MCZ9300553.1 hypothetical protein [Corynebacterium marquesiae]
MTSSLLVVEEVVVEELEVLEEEVAEGLVLVSGDDSESGEEHAERMRVSAAPRIKAGDLRDMKGPFGERARFVLGREVSP